MVDDKEKTKKSGKKKQQRGYSPGGATSRADDEDRGWLDPTAFWDEVSKQKDAGVSEDESDLHEKMLSSSLPPEPEKVLHAPQTALKQPEPLEVDDSSSWVRPYKPVSSPATTQKPVTFRAGKPASARIRWVQLVGMALALGVGTALVFLVWTRADQPPSSKSPKPNQLTASVSGLRKVEPDRVEPRPAGLEKAERIEGQGQSTRESKDLRTATLLLHSKPQGALVLINGERRGVTPTKIQGILPGESVAIRIELDEYRPWTHEITFDSSTLNRELRADLFKEEECEQGTGWVYVSSQPPGATVELDNKLLPGKTPMVIDRVCARVSHRVRIRAVGYPTWWRDFKVKPGDVLTLRAVLKK